MSFDYLRQIYQEKMDQNFHRPGVKMIEYRHFFDNIPFLVCQKYNLHLDKNIHIRGYIIGFAANKLPRKLSAHIFSRMSSNHVGPNEEYQSIYTSNMYVQCACWWVAHLDTDSGLREGWSWRPGGLAWLATPWTQVDRSGQSPECPPLCGRLLSPPQLPLPRAKPTPLLCRSATETSQFVDPEHCLGLCKPICANPKLIWGYYTCLLLPADPTLLPW